MGRTIFSKVLQVQRRSIAHFRPNEGTPPTKRFFPLPPRHYHPQESGAGGPGAERYRERIESGF